MNQEMYEEAVRSNILSRQLIEELLNSLDYTGISFINSTIEVLKVIRTRLERGDRITDEVSGITYTMDSFYNFVKDHFSSYILSQVFDDPAHAEKCIFHWSPAMEAIIWSWQTLLTTRLMSGSPP